MCIRDRVDGNTEANRLDHVMVQAVTRPGGSFKIKCAAAADALKVDEQFPLYEILEPYRTFQKELRPLSMPEPVHPELKETEPGMVFGKVLDAATAAPLPGALVRVWRGVPDPSGDLMIEGFAGEAYTCLLYTSRCV